VKRLVVILPLFLGVASKTFGATPQDLAAGKKLYTGKCARCHKFYDPTAYDDTKWNKWMQKMKLKAKLNDAQFQQLTNYVTTLRAGNKP
jgi:mono/diheme cytochrome c family protein